MLSEQQQRIMGYFIEEAKDHLNTIEQGLVNLQSTITDSEMVHEVFRAAHSVKGGAAMLGLNSIQHTAHRLEDYFKVLKECPQVRVDQKLETLFLRVYDTLQDQVDHLQGPFGLTDDKAQEAMAIVEPVFTELNQHLILLVNQSGATPPDDVEFIPATAAQSLPSSVPSPAQSPSQPAVAETSALQFIFQNDVPVRLREMLQLFKQAESEATREQLQDLCRDLAQSGEQFNLVHWCELLRTAQRAIANPDHTYRSLAPVIIKEVKRSQELVLSDRATEIAASEELLDLLPFESVPEAEPEADLTDLWGAIDLDDRHLESTAPADLAIDADLSTSLFAEESETSEESEADWFAEMFSPDDATATTSPNGHEAELNFDLGFEQISSAASSSDDLDLSFIDRLDDDSLSVEMGERNGPQVGAAELNSLADLFEGELPDLGMTWQEEEVIGLPASDALESPLENSGDFFDLLDQDNSDELALDEVQEDDLSGLLNAAALQSNPPTSTASLSFEPIVDTVPQLQDRLSSDNLPPDFELPEPASPDEMAMFFFADEQPEQPLTTHHARSEDPDPSPGFQNLDELFAGIEVDEFAASSAEAPDSSEETLPAPTELDAGTIEQSNPLAENDLADLFESEFESELDQAEAASLPHIEAEDLESFSNFLLDNPASETVTETSFEASFALPIDQPADRGSAEISDSLEEMTFLIEEETDQQLSNYSETLPEADVLPDFWEEPQNETPVEHSNESIAVNSQHIEDTPGDTSEDISENTFEITTEDVSEDFDLGNDLEGSSIAVENITDALNENADSEFDLLNILFTGEDLSQVEQTTDLLSLPDEPINQPAATNVEAVEFDLDRFFTEDPSNLESEPSPSPFETVLASEIDFEQITEPAESTDANEVAFSFDSTFDDFDQTLEPSLESIDEASDYPVDLNFDQTEASVNDSMDSVDSGINLTEMPANLEALELAIDPEDDIENDIESGIEINSETDPGDILENNLNHVSDVNADALDFDLFSDNDETLAAEAISSPVDSDLELELLELEPVSASIDESSQEGFADLEFILGGDSLEIGSEPVSELNTSVTDSDTDIALDYASGDIPDHDLNTVSNHDEFADLDIMLGEPPSLPVTTIITTQLTEAEDFADLEALLGDESVAPPPPPISPAIEVPFIKTDDEFGDLEALLQDTDQKLGVGSSPVRNAGSVSTRRPARRNVIADQTMRVSVKHLDNLNNLVGEMVVNRNSLEQTQERLRQFLDNLLYQVQQLSDVGQRMRDLYERSLLESSLMASRRSYQLSGSSSNSTQTSHATGMSFDALEMDKFTGFHTLSQEMIELIVRVRESASDIDFVVEESDQVTRNFRQITTQLQEGLTRSRMVPFAQTADRLPRGVRDNAIKYGKQAELHIEGRDTLIDKMIVEQLYDPMTHLVNNAIAHGIETSQERTAAGKSAMGRIIVRAFHQGNQTVISVSDDGAGINTDAVKAKAVAKRLITAAEAEQMSRLEAYDLLFHHGFSTADNVDDLRGRGVGLDVVRNNLSEIRGSISIDSAIGKGSTFTIRLPLTLSISKALCCISNRARIAFPMDGVEDMLDVPKERIYMDEEGHPCIQWRDALLPFQPLAELLKYNRVLGRGSVYGGSQEDDILSIVVLRSAGNYLALQVDQVLGEQEIVIKQLEGPVPKPIGIAGATVLGDGRIMPIADVLELIDLSQGRIRREAGNALWDTSGDQVTQDTAVLKTDPTVLIVDDSITVRELLSMTFNKVGYRVEQARDGQEAWEKLRSGLPCDLVFCDIEMPRMDGLELLSRLQKDANLCHIPIAMLTSRGADRHRQMAVQLGAKGYFTKPYLEEMLLDAAQRMLKGEVLVTNAGG